MLVKCDFYIIPPFKSIDTPNKKCHQLANNVNKILKISEYVAASC